MRRGDFLESHYYPHRCLYSPYFQQNSYPLILCPIFRLYSYSLALVFHQSTPFLPLLSHFHFHIHRLLCFRPSIFNHALALPSQSLEHSKRSLLLWC